MQIDLSKPLSRTRFGAVVGIGSRRVAELIADGTLPEGGTAGQWIAAYTERLRSQASGRGTGDEDLNLTQERAALARAQREAVELKTSRMLGEYAPIEALQATLAAAGAGLAARIDQVPALLRRKCPKLPADARDVLVAHFAKARNEWVRETTDLVVTGLEAQADEEDEEPAEVTE